MKSTPEFQRHGPDERESRIARINRKTDQISGNRGKDKNAIREREAEDVSADQWLDEKLEYDNLASAFEKQRLQFKSDLVERLTEVVVGEFRPSVVLLPISTWFNKEKRKRAVVGAREQERANYLSAKSELNRSLSNCVRVAVGFDGHSKPHLGILIADDRQNPNVKKALSLLNKRLVDIKNPALSYSSTMTMTIPSLPVSEASSFLTLWRNSS